MMVRVDELRDRCEILATMLFEKIRSFQHSLSNTPGENKTKTAIIEQIKILRSELTVLRKSLEE